VFILLAKLAYVFFLSVSIHQPMHYCIKMSQCVSCASVVVNG
jgi:hypothetical protein